MKKIVYSLLFVSSIALGQVEKKVENFTKIKILDKMEVRLVHSNEASVIIDGIDENDESGEKVVELISKNGELQVKRTPTKLESGEDVSITINYKNINVIEVDNGTIITSDTSIKTPSLTILAKESSEVRLPLEVEKLSCRVESSATIALEGKAKKQDIVAKSGGIYEAEYFVTEETTIISDAGDHAYINATNFVMANSCNNGSITIFGKPIQIYQNRSEGGTIKEED